MFPSSAAILDPMTGPIGPMTSGNWLADAGDDPMRIVSGGGAQATNANVTAIALWHIQAAIAVSAFATVTVLPAAPNFAGVGMTDSPQINIQIAVSLDPTLAHLNLLTVGGTTSFTPGTFQNGDGIGVTYAAGTDIATAWWRPAGAAGWTNVGTRAGGLTLAPTGWYLWVGAGDAANLRMRDFGGDTLPSGSAAGRIGHGSC